MKNYNKITIDESEYRNKLFNSIKEFLYSSLDFYFFVSKSFFEDMNDLVEEKKVFLAIILTILFHIFLNPIVLFIASLICGIILEINIRKDIRRYRQRIEEKYYKNNPPTL